MMKSSPAKIAGLLLVAGHSSMAFLQPLGAGVDGRPAPVAVASPTLAFREYFEPALADPPKAAAGQDCVAFVNQELRFDGWGASADDTVVEYAWDFESDGRLDFVSPATGVTTHRFREPGAYRSVLTVRDSEGRTARSVRRVTVVATEAAQARAVAPPAPALTAQVTPPDGTTHRYAILFNGGTEARFWTDVTLAYAMLTEGYGFTPQDIYVLNADGVDPAGGNPGGMIDFPASFEALETVFTTLAAVTDADDELFFWITDHGYGYEGPLDEGGRFLGYLAGRATVDPGDEPDYPESDFKLRSLFSFGDFASNHGLDVWKVCQEQKSQTSTLCWRNKYVSHFQNVFVAGQGLVSDNDVLIEHFVDYLVGDTDRNGFVDTTRGECMDSDGDGLPPYNPLTGEFDEDDWGEIDQLEDDFNNINSGVPEGGRPYQIFDEGLKGKLCIDLAYDGLNLQVDGRDEDGQGLFDWIDANQDGDIDDMISIDEAVYSTGDDIYDDDLRALLGLLSVRTITIVAEPCFSGGLVEDLSGPGRVICTATIEESRSWGNSFIRGFVAALHGQNEYGSSVNCDANGDGEVSMLEAFNYAARFDPMDEIPQYDDNGDGISHPERVPAGGDGSLGAKTFLRSPAAAVMSRHVFYNNSAFDGESIEPSEADDAAIAWGKSALLPGSTASYFNYTSYDRGINGIMIDLRNLPGTPTAADFTFKLGNDDSPENWVAAPPPLEISVRPGVGVGGSDRVTVTWADNAIRNTWLQVTVLATANTGLPSQDVFYFGNAVGECGNDSADAIVNVTDVAITRANPHSPLYPATIDCPYDYDRDELVNVTDVAIARANQTSPLTALQLITPP